MDLDELQSVQSRERQTDSLQQLRSSFYKEAGEFLERLREERERAAERADDPWNSPEVSRLSDDIETAEQTVEAIYERRVGKVVKMASLAAADMPTEDDGLTDEEQQLFETLVGAIEANRSRVEAVLDGEDPTPIEHGRSDQDRAAVDSDPSKSLDAGSEQHPSPEGGEPSSPESDTNASASRTSTTESPSTGEDSEQDHPVPPQDPDRIDSSTDTDADSTDQSRETRDPVERQASAGVDAADLMGGDPEDAPTRERPADGQGGRTDPPGDGHGDREDPPKDGHSAGEATEDTEETVTIDRETVRITNDVGEIYGVDDRAYELSQNDVVRLPAANAEPLVEDDAAERLE